ncbi:CehA/McbA family metallohydrolase [Novipirellula sp.]|uniref:CehA/McbA family metallohydrolase n=1 Tax=Novipirellula sp. TaxID=2795430 RepID=UPI003563E620
MQLKTNLLFLVALVVVPCPRVHCEQVLVSGLRHVRIEGPPEWTEFPNSPDERFIDVKFKSSENKNERSLVIQQQDVKQGWDVTINGTQLGRLRIDENDMRVYFPVPANVLRQGENVLRIEQAAQRNTVTDDVRIGNIRLLDRMVEDVLSEASCELTIVGAESGLSLPSRITVLNSDGALQAVAASSGDHLAVRPGVIYTSNGSARFGLPAGRYTIFAGRGFEYSVERIEIAMTPGQSVQRTLKLTREVDTEGLVACDTHVHTLTHSGHGDATVEERMITLAAEGIEMPVATDHNSHVDYRPFARQANVSEYFTPMIGNEVTSRIGHVNIFPVATGEPIPDHTLTSWQALLDDICATPNVKVAILNHARDQHSSVTPFGPLLHNAVVGENLEGWHFGFNAMEVLNSSATQTDILRLFHDWMAVLNRGYRVTPVGSSDSHDVGRYIVGQGRTYIRCDDRDPGNIDVDDAVDKFLQGEVLVSYGLLTKLVVEDSFQSGQTATADGDTLHLKVHVLGPHWTEASRIILYRNGQQIAERDISERRPDLATGVKAVEGFRIPKPKHDVYFVAIAIGPGIEELYWKTAKPYQPMSPDWQSHVVGCSGAVWLDADQDGKTTPAHEYARDIFMSAGGDLNTILKSLEDFDEATAIQAAHRVQQAGNTLLDDSNQAFIRKAAPQTRRGIAQYLSVWRETQMAKFKP